ncbi:hypothetical protein [Crystallibacter degradans]|nr:hypothetical protein [Arthrobacter sp. SF27]NMR30428.1 hypothetical protein [Arthrobacter sp. SF27]
MTHTVLEEIPTDRLLESTTGIAADAFLDACGFGSARCPYCDGPETD